METIGIDLSLSNTGIARKVVDEAGLDGLVTSSIKVATLGDMDQRLFEITSTVSGACLEMTPDLIVLEGLSFASNMPSAQERAGLHFMVRARLREIGRPFIVVPPTTLKKFICGTGAAKKELMLKEVYRRYGVDTTDNNQADAAALAIFGMAYLGGLAMTKQQEDMMRIFKLPKVKKGRAA